MNESILKKYQDDIGFVCLALLFYGLSFYSFQLYHTLAEGMVVLISMGIFILIWNARRFLDDGFLLLLGIGFMFAGVLGFLHSLSIINGSPFIGGLDINKAIQFQLLAVLMQSLALATAPFFINKKIKAGKVFLFFAILTVIIIAGVLSARFIPSVYNNLNNNFTIYNKIGEALAASILLLAILHLYKKRSFLSSRVRGPLAAMMFCLVVSQFLLFFRGGATDQITLFGHVFRLIAFYLIYKAIVVEGLSQPYDLLFRNLSQSEKTVKALLDSIPDAAYFCETDGKIIAVNKAGAERFKMSIEKMIGLNFFSIMPPDLAKVRRANVEKLFKTGQPLHFSDERAGMFLENSIYPIFDENGILVKAAIFSRDVTEKKRTENEILKSKQFSDSVINSMPGIFYVFDENGKFVMVNKRFYTDTGYGESEVFKMSPIDFFDDDEKKSIQAAVKEVFVKGESSVEANLLNKKGIKIPFYFTGYRATIDGQNLLVGLGVDITERKKIEYAAKVSELSYRRLFETAKDGILLVDFNTGMILDVNKFLIDLLGFTKEDFLKKYFWEVGTFKDVIASKENFTTLQEKRHVRFEDLPLQTKAGKKINVEFVANAYGVDGTTVIQCNIRDITARRKIEGELVETATQREEAIKDLEKFKLAVESASDHIIITDHDGTILYANKAAEAITGFSQKEMIGTKAGALWGKKMPTKFYEEMWKTIKTDKKTFHGEINNRRKNGEDYIAETSVTPILNAKGEVRFFVGIERDITKAKQIDLMKSEFVSVASHQMRTPLTGIKWFTEILLNKKDNLTAEQVDYLNQISISNNRMVQLVDDLLNIPRIDTGHKFDIVLENADIVPVVKEVIKELAPLTGQKKCLIKLAPDFPKKLILPIDQDKIKLVFHNLCANAAQYSTKQCHTEVGYKKEKGEAIFYVKDSGVGIPKNQQSRIFEKFFRADNARANQPNGTGLGLYIVKAVVEGHKGKIWFDSTEGKGSTFYFSLPIK